MGLECINGLKDEHIKVHGKIIECMVKENTHGQMEENMKDNISWTKNMDLVNTIGMMENYMKVNGKMI